MKKEQPCDPNDLSCIDRGIDFNNMIKEQIRNELKMSDISYQTWIEPLKIYIGAPKRTVEVVLPSSVAKEYVKKRFYQNIRDIFTDLLNEEIELVFRTPV